MIPSENYTVEYIAGIIYFDEPIPTGDSLTVRFQYIPLSLQSRYSLHSPVEDKSSFVRDKKPSEERTGYVSSDLTVRGSKGFSVETGYGAGGLSQSLNLTITGDIVKGMKTSAHISDKSANTGTSQRIEEIDRIYIEAKSENFKGTFGDFEFVESKSSLSGFSRKLTGLDLNYKSENYALKGAAAFFPGEYSSVTLNGIDGRLGPYYLRDLGGREGIAVLAGSEKVYIDGIIQKRGSENDYTIDYEAGAIEFAPSKIITDQTRITVEYEIARQEFSRSFYTAGGRAEISPGLNVYAAFTQEGDRSDSPKSFELTDENRQLLEGAGDDRLSASRDGAVYVGVGNGDYDAVDSSGVIFYRYVGSNIGDYDVAFSFIGSNSGSYRPLGGGVYEYAGMNSGDYEPLILLPLPRVKRYGSLGSSYALDDSSFFVEAELFGSVFDKNTISKKDILSKGWAGNLVTGFKRRLGGSSAFVGVLGRLRSISIDAVFPGKIDPVERYREYDLQPESGHAGETVREMNFESGLDDNRKLNIALGILTRPDISERQRYAGDLTWRLPGMINWFGRLERTRGDRTWWKRSMGLGVIRGRIKPAIRVNYESRDGDSGFKYHEYVSSIPAEYGRGITGDTELTYRDEKYLDGQWLDKFRSGSIRQKLEFVFGGSGLSGELSGSYFRKEYRDLSGPDTDQKSGSMRVSYGNPDGKGKFFLSERLTSSVERLRSKTYIFAGEGKGRYRYEDGVYIEDPDGDYVLLIEELGEGAKITEISTEISGTISPFLIIDPRQRLETRIGRAVIESELTYRLKKSSDVLIGRDFYPWRSGELENIPFTNGRADLRFYFYPAETRQRWKYSFTRSYQEGNPFANETVSERFRSDGLSWALPVSQRINILFDGLISNKKSMINGIGYSIDRHSESLKTDYSFSDKWTLETGFGFEEAKQTDYDFRARIPSVKIRLIGDFGKKGRASANVAYYRVLVNPEGSYIPYQVAAGKKEGNNYSANFRVRAELYENGRLDLFYRFEKFAGRRERHNMKIEFTMLFQ